MSLSHYQASDHDALTIQESSDTGLPPLGIARSWIHIHRPHFNNMACLSKISMLLIMILFVLNND